MNTIKRSELPDLTPEQVADALCAAFQPGRGGAPRPKSRQDSTAIRVVKSYRVRPDTAEVIADESRDTGLSQGQVIDWLARFLDGRSVKEGLSDHGQ